MEQERQDLFIVARSMVQVNVDISKNTPLWSTIFNNIEIFQNLWKRKENASVYVIFIVSGSNTFCGIALWVQQARPYSNAFQLEWVYKDVQVRVPDKVCTSDATVLNTIQGNLILRLFKTQTDRRLYQFEKRKLTTIQDMTPIKKRKICV